MDALLWVALSATALVVLGWLASRIDTGGALPPKPGEGGSGDREPRDPRPLVLTGSAKEPVPEPEDRDA